MEVRTRLAPSPTGKLHLGTAYASLWPYFFAKRNKGIFVLRLEDTDRERSTQGFAEEIISSLKWLGISWDEGPYYQMDRLSLYKEASQKLLDEGKAYFCFCSKEELGEERERQKKKGLPQVYSGKCRNLNLSQAAKEKANGTPFVIRHKVVEGRSLVEFEDLIHGHVSFNSELLGDMVIMRSNGIPLYNFAVVVDDIDMRITHVIRGDDHLSNTPKQILFFEALGKNLPKFAHYPLILNQDRIGKLSKRAGSTSVDEYRKEGYLPDAVFNYLALLGWTPPNEEEVLSKEQMIELFDIKDINKSASAWNEAKLEWINGEYIRRTENSKLKNQISEYLKGMSSGSLDHPTEEEVEKVIPLVKERIKKLSDFIPLTDFLWEKPEYDMVQYQNLKIKNQNVVLNKILEKLEEMEKPWEAQVFEQTFRKLAQDESLSATQMFQLIRVAISGQSVTPPLFECIKNLGEQESILRVKKALEFVSTTQHIA